MALQSLEELVRYKKIPQELVVRVYPPADKQMRDTPAMIAVRKFLETDNAALLALYGTAGCGKTLACAWWLVQRSGDSGLWLQAPTLARVPHEGTADPVIRACEAQSLVIDDVGIEHSPGGYALSRLQEIVEFRELHRKRTVLSTNLTPAEFVARYGDRLASRIDGDAIGWVNCGTEDMRRRHV